MKCEVREMLRGYKKDQAQLVFIQCTLQDLRDNVCISTHQQHASHKPYLHVFVFIDSSW